jgi:hypothetical protein
MTISNALQMYASEEYPRLYRQVALSLLKNGLFSADTNI